MSSIFPNSTTLQQPSNPVGESPKPSRMKLAQEIMKRAQEIKKNKDAAASQSAVPPANSLTTSSSSAPSSFAKLQKIAANSLKFPSVALSPFPNLLNKIDETGRGKSASSSSSTSSKNDPKESDQKESFSLLAENDADTHTSSSSSSSSIPPPPPFGNNPSSTRSPGPSRGPSNHSTRPADDDSNDRGFLYAFTATLIGATIGYVYSQVVEAAPKLASGAFATSALAFRILGHYAAGFDATNPAYAWKTRSYGYFALSTVSIAAFRALQLINNLAVYSLVAATTILLVGNMIKKN